MPQKSNFGSFLPRDLKVMLNNTLDHYIELDWNRGLNSTSPVSYELSFYELLLFYSTPDFSSINCHFYFSSILFSSVLIFLITHLPVIKLLSPLNNKELQNRFQTLKLQKFSKGYYGFDKFNLVGATGSRNRLKICGLWVRLPYKIFSWLTRSH